MSVAGLDPAVKITGSIGESRPGPRRRLVWAAGQVLWEDGSVEFERVTAREIVELEGLDDWRFVLGALHADFDAGSFPVAAGLVTAITDAAEELWHHPDLHVRYPGRVHVVLTTHAVGGLTTLDVDLARAISRAASELGATSAPGVGQAMELAIDTMDADRIRPFWAAVLGYVDRDGVLHDPRRTGPPVWFQQMDEPRTQRNRIHVDVSVPHDVADERIAAALAAGGTLVSDRRARAFWVLADADGNEACISTWQDR
jgi:4a-hydroxytetrahydrobiopterin dehydratase